MAGFEYARPDAARDLSLDAYAAGGSDYYSHPDLVQTLQDSES